MIEADMDLVRAYANEGSELAFETLVSRHIGLVYSSALRQVRDPHLAEEITQVVFTILARKAGFLNSRTILPGWLYRTTRFTAANALRTRAARQRNEQGASMQSTIGNAESEAAWHELGPLLDEAMESIGQSNRNALLLRFFENKSLREVGMVLGTTEESAKKRVARSLEKLRIYFQKRGVVVSTVAIASAVSAHSVQAVPVALTSAVVAVAHGATVIGSGTAMANEALKLMAWAKFKTTVVTGAAIVIAVIAPVTISTYFKSRSPAAPGRTKLPIGEVQPMIGFGYRSHGIILASEGSLWAWGAEEDGWPVLGLNNVRNSSSLRRIGNETNWISVAVGESHTLAVKADGSLWGWGGNIHHQLGEDIPRMQRVPAQISSGNDWIQVATGSAQSLALKKDGSLWAWGSNWAGPLGIGDIRETSIAVQVGMDQDWKRLWAGGIQTVAQKSNGSLWFWGSLTGESSDTNKFFTPMRISAETNWVDVCFGYFTTFAIKSDGTLWCWGREARFYTGAPDDRFLSTPTRIGSDADWKSCASPGGGFYHLLLKKNGSLWAMDASEHRRTKPSNRYGLIKFQEINLHKDIIALGAGGDSTGVALTRDGEVWTWGVAPGEYTSGNKLLQGAAAAIRRVRPDLAYDWGAPAPVFRNEPWRLPNIDPNDPSAR